MNFIHVHNCYKVVPMFYIVTYILLFFYYRCLCKLSFILNWYIGNYTIDVFSYSSQMCKFRNGKKENKNASYETEKRQ